MRFQELLDAAPDVLSRPTGDAEVTAPISEDHRYLKPGGVFVARKGQHFDSHAVIGEAAAAGAVAVVGEYPPERAACPVPYAQVADAQQALGFLAAASQGFPSRALIVIGVTGTDGKTTTTNLVYNILRAAGFKAGMISTVNAVIGDEKLDTGLHTTTPSAPDIQHYLRRMVNAGLTHCVLETTSHGLAQGRVNGVDYDVAVLTNLTHEHLDFHGSFEAYRDAKARLFRMLSATHRKPDQRKVAVVNVDDPNAAYFMGIPADQRLTYSTDKHAADFSALAWMSTPRGTTVRINMAGVSLLAETSLIGQFNIQNMLAAAAAGYAAGCGPQAVIDGIQATPPVPGRMELIDEGQAFTAIVDFAHTPNALRRALETVRQLTNERVIAVFGSAGLRDREKRRLMAEISAELADITVLTAEDPRTESLDAILNGMAEAAKAKG
ncbi:MAG: UDP-N-acetylmuramoyl-L-alanyl-D-glutamate--2,6-diaminopimelate ligase, partial [Anaerolineae bacterium]|nr:UDP-N-acetylmuramoyl-L-alanyl-D-glutamate--2,6-diaminopimelate ligase [Anaerolineae bacterium]